MEAGATIAFFVHAAHACGSQYELLEIDQTDLAVSACHEQVLEPQLQGTAFSQTTAAIFVNAFARNLVLAVVRAVPLGQTAGQRVFVALIPLCDQIAKQRQSTTPEDLSNTAFLSDIAAMQHETLQPRMS